MLEILYRDQGVVVVDKPGGLLVHRSPEARGERDALLQRVRDQLGRRVYLVNRLDRAASGLVVCALSAEDAALWQRSLAQPDCVKRYLALVRGGECPARWSSERPLGDALGRKRAARTSFELLAQLGWLALLSVRLHSGRRHQIRRHLAHAGRHVVGDTRYGKGRLNNALREQGLPRMFLHASRLRVEHPRSAQTLELHSPLPADLRGFLDGLSGLPSGLLERL